MNAFFSPSPPSLPPHIFDGKCPDCHPDSGKLLGHLGRHCIVIGPRKERQQQRPETTGLPRNSHASETSRGEDLTSNPRRDASDSNGTQGQDSQQNSEPDSGENKKVHLLLEKPKRGKSPYILFMVEKRASVAAELGGSPSMTEVMREVAGMWKALTQEQRIPWVGKCKKDQERYNRDLERWRAQERSKQERSPTLDSTFGTLEDNADRRRSGRATRPTELYVTRHSPDHHPKKKKRGRPKKDKGAAKEKAVKTATRDPDSEEETTSSNDDEDELCSTSDNEEDHLGTGFLQVWFFSSLLSS
jgi:hypothetical protein